jgi:hypothetical protein
MRPRDWVILGKVFEGKRPKVIAAELGITPAVVRARLSRPEFKAAQSQLEATMMERIARGEFGILAMAKAEAVGAFRRVLGQSKLSPDEKVRFNANVLLMKLAGIREPAPAAIETPERLIDMMTAEEAEVFSTTGEFPERFADQLARLTTAVLEAQERRRWGGIRVEQIEHQRGDDPSPPQRRLPREVLEGEDD